MPELCTNPEDLSKNKSLYFPLENRPASSIQDNSAPAVSDKNQILQNQSASLAPAPIPQAPHIFSRKIDIYRNITSPVEPTLASRKSQQPSRPVLKRILFWSFVLFIFAWIMRRIWVKFTATFTTGLGGAFILGRTVACGLLIRWIWLCLRSVPPPAPSTRICQSIDTLAESLDIEFKPTPDMKVLDTSNISTPIMSGHPSHDNEKPCLQLSGEEQTESIPSVSYKSLSESDVENLSDSFQLLLAFDRIDSAMDVKNERSDLPINWEEADVSHSYRSLSDSIASELSDSSVPEPFVECFPPEITTLSTPTPRSETTTISRPSTPPIPPSRISSMTFSDFSSSNDALSVCSTEYPEDMLASDPLVREKPDSRQSTIAAFEQTHMHFPSDTITRTTVIREKHKMELRSEVVSHVRRASDVKSLMGSRSSPDLFTVQDDLNPVFSPIQPVEPSPVSMKPSPQRLKPIPPTRKKSFSVIPDSTTMPSVRSSKSEYGELQSNTDILTLKDIGLEELSDLSIFTAQITILNLSYNCLVELPDALFSRCPLIEVLDLRHNVLKSVSECIQSLRFLRVLHIQHNNLHALPACTFRNLEVLNLSHNLLETLADTWFTRQLYEVDLSNNKLSTLDFLHNLSRDCILDITGNAFTPFLTKFILSCTETRFVRNSFSPRFFNYCQDSHDLWIGTFASRVVRANSRVTLHLDITLPESKPDANKRVMTLQELLSTEQTYVNELTQLMKLYITPLQEVLSKVDMDSLFGTLTSIANFHSSNLLPRLQRHVQPSANNGEPNLGTCISSANDGLRLYSIYYNQFEDILQYFGVGLGGSPVSYNKKRLSAILDRAKSHRDHSQLDLSSYLLLPVQRLPRYKLLLERLLSATNPGDQDYHNVLNSYQIICRITAACNDEKRRTEDYNNAVQICSVIRRPAIAATTASIEDFKNEQFGSFLGMKEVLILKVVQRASSANKLVVMSFSKRAKFEESFLPPLLETHFKSRKSNLPPHSLDSLEWSFGKRFSFFIFQHMMLWTTLRGPTSQHHDLIRIHRRGKVELLYDGQNLSAKQCSSSGSKVDSWRHSSTMSMPVSDAKFSFNHGSSVSLSSSNSVPISFSWGSGNQVCLLRMVDQECIYYVECDPETSKLLLS